MCKSEEMWERCYIQLVFEDVLVLSYVHWELDLASNEWRYVQ